MGDVREKIRKLLALGEGKANEHEAARAMELASELMMRHGIERDELKGDDAPRVIEGHRFNVDYPWYRFLVNAACKLYGTEAIYWRGGDVLRCNFVGRSENIDAAQDTLAFLILQVEALYKAMLPKGMTKAERADFRKTFKLACASRVYSRAWQIVEDQVSKATKGTAIAIIDHRVQLQNEASAFINRNGPLPEMKQVTVKEGRGTIAGRSAGDAVDLNRSVEPVALQHDAHVRAWRAFINTRRIA